MDRPAVVVESKPKRVSTVWPRIAGSLAGLLIGGVHLGAVAFGIATLLLSTALNDASLEVALAALILCPILAALAPCPFMLAGIPLALALIAAGAVIGSGWKARPSGSTGSAG